MSMSSSAISVVVTTLVLGTATIATAVPPQPPTVGSPSCMLNGKPCPLPKWEVDWSVYNSTALMSVDPDGYLPTHHWGFVTLDWQCGAHKWLKPNIDDIYCEATAAQNCRELKQKGLVKRCSIYHNMELALEWLESERPVMDQAHVDAGWYLRFPNGSVFNDVRQYRPGVGPTMNQYFIDWRNKDAAAYFVSAIVNATHLLGVDATFTDDSVGVPDEHPELGPDLNLSTAELTAIQHATQLGGQQLVTELASSGKTCWDCFGGRESPIGGTWGHNQHPPTNDATQCATQMRTFCAPEMQQRSMFMEWETGSFEKNATNYPEQNMAAFLIARPPMAWLGSSYGLSDTNWSPLFALDVGEPLGICTETTKGVFTRKWTKGDATLDCNTFTATLPFPSLLE